MPKLVKLGNKLYCLPFDTFSDRPNLYYVLGKEASVAIDAGNSKRHCNLFYDELLKNNLPNSGVKPLALAMGI